MRKILVPLDGSALAEQALPQVRLLAHALGARVHLLRVISHADHAGMVAHESLLLTRGGTIPPLQTREQHAWKQLQTHAERYLAAQAGLLRRAGIDAEAEISVGQPAETIVQVATRDGCALVALATHGYSGLSRWALGSVADRVVQAVSTPVLLVRGAAQPPSDAPRISRILVPLDGSAFARRALPLALDLAAQSRATLLLLAVLEPTLGIELGMPAPRERDLAARRDWLAREAADLARQPRMQPPAIETVVREGYAAEEIVDAAAHAQADLIVMATHGRGGLSRWALGSVADKVLHAATTPLLLVPPRSRGEPGRGVTS